MEMKILFKLDANAPKQTEKEREGQGTERQSVRECI